MIGYVTLGTNDLDRAARFYDALLAEIGAGRYMADDRFVAWAVAPDKPALGVIKPYDGKPVAKMADIAKPGTFTSGMMGGYRAGKKEELIRVK